MSIVRLALGRTEDLMPSPEVTQIVSNSARYFVDFETYLVGILGFAHMAEAANSGSATRYRPEDTVLIGCKQEGMEWYWRAEATVSYLSRNFSAGQLFLQRYSAPLPSRDDVLCLGALDALMHNFGQALGTNFFERNRHFIENSYGSDPKDWPDVWDFARVVRNAMSHGGRIFFNNPNANAVSWKGLTYSPADNGKAILHTDIWPGDLFDLIIEMDSRIP